MRHYIIVKYKPSVENKQMLFAGISGLFSEAEAIDGVHVVSLYPAIIEGDNRYDLMIVMEMEREALTVFDNSHIHKRWKEQYSDIIERKAIFDCD